MKEAAGYVVAIMAFLVFIGLLMFGVRKFSNTVTPITVHQVAPGVKCATMVTGDGAAISCWKDEPEEAK